MTSAANDYSPSRARFERSGAALDDHLSQCPTCSAGVACPDGDDKAMNEYRAFREAAWLERKAEVCEQLGAKDPSEADRCAEAAYEARAYARVLRRGGDRQ